jgi:hypothetical protein
MKREISREHDPSVIRALAVGLHCAGQLDRATKKKIIARIPQLRRTIDYLEGRSRLPSLVYTDRWVEVPSR